MHNTCVGFGKFIQSVREYRKLTRKEFAHECGVAVETLSKWENDHIKPRLAKLEAMLAPIHIKLEDCLQLPHERLKDEDRIAELAADKLQARMSFRKHADVEEKAQSPPGKKTTQKKASSKLRGG